MTISDPMKNEAAGARYEGAQDLLPHEPAPQAAYGIVEPESKVQRPTTVSVFQARHRRASPCAGRPPSARQNNPAPGGGTTKRCVDLARSLSAIPVFIVGAGRELLGRSSRVRPRLPCRCPRDALAAMTRIYPRQLWPASLTKAFPGGTGSSGSATSSTPTEPPTGRPQVGRGCRHRRAPPRDSGPPTPRALVVNVVAALCRRLGDRTAAPARCRARRYLEVRISDIKGSRSSSSAKFSIPRRKTPGLADEVA